MNKNFSSFFKNKRVFSLVLGITLFFSFLPISSVKAAFCGCPALDVFCIIGCLVGYVLSLPYRIGLLVTILPLLLTVFACSFLFGLTVDILNWVVSIILSISVIPGRPESIAVVNIGWEFTRDFANMFFILAMVFIGLSTILRIKDYEAKKALPNLIIIALLINFTPVIVGFVVDMTNIVTAFFLDKIGGGFSFVPVATGFIEKTVTDIFSIEFNPIVGFVDYFLAFASNVILGVAIIVFYLYATYIFCLAISIFFLRLISLWTLMILSPIAFMSYIFPQTDKAQMVFPSILGWKKWWEELLQWAIVGIPFGFFLYLSSVIMSGSAESLGFTITTNDLVYGTATFQDLAMDIIGQILAPILGLALLHRGYKISKEAAPAGAKAVIEGVESVGKMAVTAGKAYATGGASLAMGGAVGAVGKVAARIPGARGLTKHTEAYKDKQTKNWHERFDKVPEGFKDMESSKGQLRIMNTEMKRGRSGRVVGMWNSLSKERQKLLLEKDKKEGGNLRGSLATASHEIGEEDRYKEAANKIDKKFSKENTYDSQLNLQIDKEAFADNIKKLKKELEEELGDEKLKVLVDTEKGKDFDEKLQNFATKVGYYKKAKTSDIDDWDKDTFKDNKALSYAMRDKGPQFAIKVHETAAPDNWEELYNGKYGVGNMTAKELKKRNSYFYHSFGRNKVLQAIGQKDIQENVGWDNVDLMGEQYEVEEMSIEDIQGGINTDKKALSKVGEESKSGKRLKSKIGWKEKLLKEKLDEAPGEEDKETGELGIKKSTIIIRARKIAREQGIAGLSRNSIATSSHQEIDDKTKEIAQKEPFLKPEIVLQEAIDEVVKKKKESLFNEARNQLIKEWKTTPLLERIEKAKPEEKKKLQKQFKGLPEPIQRQEEQILSTRGYLSESVSQEKTLKNEIKRLKGVGLTEKDKPIQDLREKLKTTLEFGKATKKAEEDLISSWRESMEFKAIGDYEKIFAKEVSILREAEKEAEKELKSAQDLKKPQNEIKIIGGVLNTIKERRLTAERKFATKLRLKEVEGRIKRPGPASRREILKKEKNGLVEIGGKLRMGQSLERDEEKYIDSFHKTMGERMKKAIAERKRLRFEATKEMGRDFKEAGILIKGAIKAKTEKYKKGLKRETKKTKEFLARHGRESGPKQKTRKKIEDLVKEEKGK